MYNTYSGWRNGTSWDKAILNSEEIKPIVFPLLIEGTSQLAENLGTFN